MRPSKAAHGIRQTTLAKRVETHGIGFHLATPAKIALCPAPADSGIVFQRVDFDRFEIPATREYVAHTAYATALIRDGIMVATVEHLLAALSGCHIDNAIIEIDSVEVPIMDGSARPFVELIEEAGTVELEAPRQFVRVLKPVEVAIGSRSIHIAPAPVLRVDCTIDFDHPWIGKQHRRISLKNGSFQQQIAAARTFVFNHEFDWRQPIGQLRGASPETALVLSRQSIINADGLRYADEFVRHKTLDIIGDLALIGSPLLGQVRATRSGHSLHNALTAKLMSDPEAWEFVRGENVQHPANTSLRQPRRRYGVNQRRFYAGRRRPA